MSNKFRTCYDRGDDYVYSGATGDGSKEILGFVDPNENNGLEVGVTGYERVFDKMQAERDGVELSRVLERYNNGQMSDISFCDYLVKNQRSCVFADVSEIQPFSYQNEAFLDKVHELYEKTNPNCSFTTFLQDMINLQDKPAEQSTEKPAEQSTEQSTGGDDNG